MQMKSRIFLCYVLSSQLFISKAAQSGRLEIRQVPGLQQSAPAPEKEPGDSIVTDTNGTIVSTSRGETFHWRLINQMKPQVAVAYSQANGTVQYEWTITNENSAKQRIASLLVDMSFPSDLSAPSPWVAIRVNRNGLDALGLLCVARDDSPSLGILPGRSLGPIRFTSNSAPGLVEATVLPTQEAMTDTSPSGLTNGQFFDRASPWVREQLLKVDTKDRHQVRLWLIGPVTPLSEDSVQKVLSELNAAAVQHADFNTIRRRLNELQIPTDSGQLSTWIAESLKQSSAGLEGDFLRALNWRLQLLR
jgi:hypothetical protein